MKNIKLKVLRPIMILFFLIVTIIILITYLSFEQERLGKMQYIETDKGPEEDLLTPLKGHKIVHLDLKGAPPKIGYLRQILPLFAKLGATGLLIEYEDMFPFSGELSTIKAFNAYTEDEIKQINIIAEENALKIIPLVPTFGHMEFVLKLEKYKELREVATYPQVICPSNNKTLPLIKEMIRQILQAHPKSNTIHIGCDEVFHLGICDKCFERLLKTKWSNFRLFLSHIIAIAQYIQVFFPKMNVLIWDDILRHIDMVEITKSDIARYVTPVVWSYSPADQTLNKHLWFKYSKTFSSVWVASAFKGATGSNQYYTNISYHLENHLSWMKILTKFQDFANYEGIFITGWQRYDHFAVLCELIPSAIPSLAMCLRQINEFKPVTKIPQAMLNLLGCKHPEVLFQDIDYNYNPNCNYSGAKLLDAMYDYNRIRERYKALLDDSRIRGWINNFNVKYRFSNPEYVEGGTGVLDSLKGELWQVEYILSSMEDVYDNYTITEWLETYVRPLEKEIVALWEKKEKLLGIDVWPRRPINSNFSTTT